jgi:hypothetical protein
MTYKRHTRSRLVEKKDSERLAEYPDEDHDGSAHESITERMAELWRACGGQLGWGQQRKSDFCQFAFSEF